MESFGDGLFHSAKGIQESPILLHESITCFFLLPDNVLLFKHLRLFRPPRSRCLASRLRVPEEKTTPRLQLGGPLDSGLLP